MKAKLQGSIAGQGATQLAVGDTVRVNGHVHLEMSLIDRLKLLVGASVAARVPISLDVTLERINASSVDVTTRFITSASR